METRYRVERATKTAIVNSHKNQVELAYILPIMTSPILLYLSRTTRKSEGQSTTPCWKCPKVVTERTATAPIETALKLSKRQKQPERQSPTSAIEIMREMESNRKLTQASST